MKNLIKAEKHVPLPWPKEPRRTLLGHFKMLVYMIAYMYNANEVLNMKSINATAFRKDLFKILDTVIKFDEPVTVTTKNGNAVLISESEYRSIMETIYLMSDREFMEGLKDADEQDRATYTKFDPKKDL